VLTYCAAICLELCGRISNPVLELKIDTGIALDLGNVYIIFVFFSMHITYFYCINVFQLLLV